MMQKDRNGAAACKEAPDRLISGFEYFKKEIYDKKPEVFGPLTEAQSPKFMVFACADSRVSPTMLFGFQPGEAITIRNIANMVAPYNKLRYSGIGADIEYSILHLKVPNIVVIGHSSCGGIKTLMSIKDHEWLGTEFMEDWVKIGWPAREKVLEKHRHLDFEEQCTLCEKESVNNSLKNLKTYPFIKEALKNKSLTLFGAYYDFVNGTFEIWD